MCPPLRSSQHLTNFSVNKRSANFVANQAGDGVGAAPGGSEASAGGGEGDSSKWSLRAFKRYLEAQYGAARCATVWAAVSDIFIKTLLSVRIQTPEDTHVPPDQQPTNLAKCKPLRTSHLILCVHLLTVVAMFSSLSLSICCVCARWRAT
jgi:hypothetical protein